MPRMEFIPGCNELFIQQMNRAQNTNKVWIAKIGEIPPSISLPIKMPHGWK